jgi:C4-type Zn-finger protein
MILGNMRANGVRILEAWCSGRGCNNYRVINVDSYADDVPVPSFGPKMHCERCGHRGADVRPNWSKRPSVGAVAIRPTARS